MSYELKINEEVHVHKYDELFTKIIESTNTILNNESHRLSCDIDRQEVIIQLLNKIDKDICNTSIFVKFNKLLRIF